METATGSIQEAIQEIPIPSQSDNLSPSEPTTTSTPSDPGIDFLARTMPERISKRRKENNHKTFVVDGFDKTVNANPRNDDTCKQCRGMGFLLTESDRRVIHCSACIDLLALSRLSKEDQKRSLKNYNSRQDDPFQEVIAMRFLAKQMLQDPYGWITLVGCPGSGKSELLVSLVADFCRQGKAAKYYSASDISNGFRIGENTNPVQFLEKLKETEILAVDEPDKTKFTRWQAEYYEGIFNYRHQHRDRLVTLIAANRPPEQWETADDVNIEHWISRFRDNQFSRMWPTETEWQETYGNQFKYMVPKCLEDFKREDRYYVPGYFQIRGLGDMRPHVWRDS